MNLTETELKICTYLSEEGNVLNCDIVVSEFELQSFYYVNFRTNSFRKGMNTPYPPSSNITVFLQVWFQERHEHSLSP